MKAGYSHAAASPLFDALVFGKVGGSARCVCVDDELAIPLSQILFLPSHHEDERAQKHTHPPTHTHTHK
jgi:hypothetical protein